MTMFDMFKRNKVENVEPENNVSKEAPEVPKEEWIWVTGYKGTDKHMVCRGYQYELGKQFDISDYESVEQCVNGFHLCLNLDDVFHWYDILDNNRFFVVHALVRKTDFDNYGGYIDLNGFYYPNKYGKLVAKSIIFEEELPNDEVLYSYIDETWTDEYKQKARLIGPKATRNLMRTNRLTELGFSETFSRIIIEKGKYEVAQSVASQRELSMDMKAWLIFNI